MSRLGGSQGTIQLALDALAQKKNSVDQVPSFGMMSNWSGGRSPRI